LLLLPYALCIRCSLLLLLLQIMGVAYYKPLSQWSKGEYAGASNVSTSTAFHTAEATSLLEQQLQCMHHSKHGLRNSHCQSHRQDSLHQINLLAKS
jgi:hypothetical protein